MALQCFAPVSLTYKISEFMDGTVALLAQAIITAFFPLVQSRNGLKQSVKSGITRCVNFIVPNAVQVPKDVLTSITFFAGNAHTPVLIDGKMYTDDTPFWFSLTKSEKMPQIVYGSLSFEINSLI